MPGLEPHVKPYVIVNVQILGYKMAVTPVLTQNMC